MSVFPLGVISDARRRRRRERWLVAIVGLSFVIAAFAVLGGAGLFVGAAKPHSALVQRRRGRPGVGCASRRALIGSVMTTPNLMPCVFLGRGPTAIPPAVGAPVTRRGP